MVMQLQEECKAVTIHCCVQTGSLPPDVLPSFMLALGSAACFLKYSWHLVQIGHCIPHQPIVAWLHYCSLGVLLVCVIKVWLAVSTEHDWLGKTSLYSQLCCSNFVEAVSEVGLDCVVLPCCKNIHLVSASKSVTMLVKSFSFFCCCIRLARLPIGSWFAGFRPWHHVAAKVLLCKPCWRQVMVIQSKWFLLGFILSLMHNVGKYMYYALAAGGRQLELCHGTNVWWWHSQHDT